MTKSNFVLELMNNYTDINGLVKPKTYYSDSDNGILFTSVAQILLDTKISQDEINACYKKPGLLNRRPNGSTSLEAFDDYLGRAIACIYTNNTKEPREILWYFVSRFGFMNNTDSFTFKAWLAREFNVWAFMFCADFPRLKYLMYPFLTLYCSLFNPNDKNNGNEVQLQWLQVMGHKKLFGPKLYDSWYSKYKLNTGSVLSVPFTSYYQEDHPFVTWIKEYYD